MNEPQTLRNDAALRVARREHQLRHNPKKQGVPRGYDDANLQYFKSKFTLRKKRELKPSFCDRINRTEISRS
jgi:hypothetical protein